MRQFAVIWLASLVGIMNLPRWPSTALGTLIIFLMLSCAFLLRGTRIAVAAMLLAVVASFFAFVQLAGQQLHAEQVSADVNLTIRVDSVPEHLGRRVSFVATVLDCHSCTRPLLVNKVKLSWYGTAPRIRADQLWKLTVRLKPPAAYRNRGSFDAVAFSLVKGIQARGYVRAKDEFVLLGNAPGTSLSGLREASAAKLSSIAGEKETLGLMQGITVGIKANIPQHQWELLRNTGTAHLLAISGLHIGLIAGWTLIFSQLSLSFALGCLQRHAITTTTFDIRPLTLMFSFTAAIGYAALAGFELPTQRALLMLGVWVIASLRFRFLPPMTALGIALILVLLSNTLNVLSAGFWLSFGTVFTLFYLHRGHLRAHVNGTVRTPQASFSKLLCGVRTHALLGLALLPVSAWFFQSGSLIAPVANLVAVPWVALVSVPLSLLTLALAGLSETLATVVSGLAIGSLDLLMWYLNELDAFRISSVVLTVPGTLIMLLSLMALLLGFAPRGLGLRWFAVPLALPLIIHNVSLNAPEGFQVHVLDVGQGLAVLVYAGEETILFDTGGKIAPDLSMFEAVVVPFLHASGRRKIDTLVVSHSDEDHSFGVDDVLSRFANVQIFASQPSQIPGSAEACVAGTNWSVGIVEFAFIHPATGDTGDDNDLSCVLMVYAGQSRALLTGDVEAAAERAIIGRMKSDLNMPVTLMTAPHHGSRSSSTQAFVNRLRPEFVVFPAGLRNRYGFPHSDVQLRYDKIGSIGFTTGTSGSVSFDFGPKGLLNPPVSWWDSYRRFWHGIVNPDCWQRFAGQSFLLRLHELMQEGKILCGK